MGLKGVGEDVTGSIYEVKYAVSGHSEYSSFYRQSLQPQSLCGLQKIISRVGHVGSQIF